MTAQILANSLENRINDAAAVLEITSKLPQIMSTPNSSLLNANIETLHGIPYDADMQKRKVALDILSNYDEFAEVAFVMPNGDRYFLEPYSFQINRTTNNFAYRDYFRGAITTNDTYLGDIITSAASGLKRAVIAVPVYSQTHTSTDQGQIVGDCVGATDIDVLKNELQSLNLTQNQRIVYVDSNGTKMADSDRRLPLNGSESFYNLTSLQNAINGESGSIAEEVGGEMMQISYAPVQAVQKMWAVLLLQSLGSINNNNNNSTCTVTDADNNLDDVA
ncbi:MAG: cache domain-containing protein [Nitrososphaeraceae archaeon]